MPGGGANAIPPLGRPPLTPTGLGRSEASELREANQTAAVLPGFSHIYLTLFEGLPLADARLIWTILLYQESVEIR